MTLINNPTTEEVSEPLTHRHGGIGLHTPASVHYGTASQVRAQRAATLTAAPTPPARPVPAPSPQSPALPTAAWIN